ncbi:MAG: glycosyltransferase family 2 protein [Thermodesulfobacterium sp.]|nr:glycosyltransferase family 2 protein [Thermodesulfobacterium sp.]
MDTVCAVVVTYNRKKLLLECLEALRKQTRPVQGIYLIDNASTDGTPKLLLEKEYIKELPPENLTEPWEKEFEIKNLTDGEIIKLHYVRMHENTGGAGGFHEGVKRAYEKGYDWLWLMDDDTIPQEAALQVLLETTTLNLGIKIGFICSKVLWTDSSPHKMNLPQLKPLINGLCFNLYEEYGILLISACSFVSMLINRKVVQDVGLPIKEFFIWNDDIEYTSRIVSKGYVGVYNPKSIVIHKTKANLSSIEIADPIKCFYNIRNNLYLIKRRSKLRFILKCVYNLLIIGRLKRTFISAHIKGILAAIFFSPKIEKIKDEQK